MENNGGSGASGGGHSAADPDRPSFDPVPPDRLPFDSSATASTESTHPLQTAGSLPPGTLDFCIRLNFPCILDEKTLPAHISSFVNVLKIYNFSFLLGPGPGLGASSSYYPGANLVGAGAAAAAGYPPTPSAAYRSYASTYGLSNGSGASQYGSKSLYWASVMMTRILVD